MVCVWILQDWYWYSLISYCIGNNAYIGCDPPDVGLQLSQASPTDSNEMPAADSSAENINMDSVRDSLACDSSIPVCNIDQASQSYVVTSFAENGFVDNMSDPSGQERILQLDGLIDKYPQHSQQPAAIAASIGQSAVVTNADSLCDRFAEVMACCGVETAGSEAEKQNVGHYHDVPVAVVETTTADNSAFDSLSVFSVVPSSLPQSADVCSSVDNSMQDDRLAADATMDGNLTFDSVSSPSIYVNALADNCMQESLNEDNHSPDAAATMAHNLPFDFDSVVNLVPASSLSPSMDSSIQESSNTDDNIPVAEAVMDEILAFDSVSAVSVVPANSPPSANVRASVDNSMNENGDRRVAYAKVDENLTFDSVSSSSPLTDVHSSTDNCMLGSVNNDADISVADIVLAAENCAFDSASGVMPTSPPLTADTNLREPVTGYIQESALERNSLDQLNHWEATIDIDETAVSQPRDEVMISADVDSQCLGTSSHLGGNNVAEYKIGLDAVYGTVDEAVGAAVSRTTDALLSSDSLPVNCALDPQILAIVDSLEKSLACRNNAINSSNKRPSQHYETPMAPINVELQRKIIRQMEVCGHNDSRNLGLGSC